MKIRVKLALVGIALLPFLVAGITYIGVAPEIPEYIGSTAIAFLITSAMLIAGISGIVLMFEG